MKALRIIPRLDIKGPNLVKGIHLEGLRVMGKPEDFAKYYYDNGADELIFQDVVASLYERNSLTDIISKTVEQVFIPITVGGGLRSIADINAVLRAGADKVSINTKAVSNPDFVKEASERFGSSTIIVAVEVIHDKDGYLIYTDNGREHTGINPYEWVQKMEEEGAGEILLTSVDKEGTGSGFDHNLISKIRSMINIPLVVHGGPGSKEDVVKLVNNTNIDGVAVASILHYNYLKNNISSSASSSEGNIEFLKSGKSFSNFKTCEIGDLKAILAENKIAIRL